MSLPPVSSSNLLPRLQELLAGVGAPATASAPENAKWREGDDPGMDGDGHGQGVHAQDDGGIGDILGGLAGAAVSDPPSLDEAQKKIDALPKPDFSDIPHNLPPEDQQAIRDGRVAIYNRQVAAIADEATAAARPPKPSDYADLPPQLRRIEYQEALQNYNAQLSKLHAESLHAKQANLRMDPEFRQLPPAVQAQALEAMEKNGADPSAIDLIAEVAGSKAFLELGVVDFKIFGKSFHFDGSTEKGKLLTLIGENTDVSQRARTALHEAIHDTGPNDPDNNQVRVSLDDAKSLDRFLWTGARPADLYRDGMPESGIPDGSRRPYTVSGPERVDHGFPSSTTPGATENRAALKYTVTVDGKAIEIILPADASKDPSHSYPTIEQIAKGLAGMPPELVQATNRVVAVPLPAAETDSQGQVVPSGADMYAGNGEITINPHGTDSPRTQKAFDTTFLHEGAHLLKQPDKDEWNEAIKSDHLFSTHYADNNYEPNAHIDQNGRNNPAEDFAEAYMIYKLVKGTPEEAQMRALMPERFAILDRMYP